jgi:hypothetical protein
LIIGNCQAASSRAISTGIVSTLMLAACNEWKELTATSALQGYQANIVLTRFQEQTETSM